MKKKYSLSGKISVSGLVMAAYIVIMALTQSFAFMAYQVRVATSLYALAYIHPFLCVPLGLANCLSNMLLGSLGIFDTLGGFAAGLVTTLCVVAVRKLKLHFSVCAVPLVLGPALIVAIWLSSILKIPYFLMASNLMVGQIIPAVIGVVLIKGLEGRI